MLGFCGFGLIRLVFLWICCLLYLVVCCVACVALAVGFAVGLLCFGWLLIVLV